MGDTKASQIASGIVEIPLGDDNGKGTTHFSGEILHGLGKGHVYVDVGFEVYDSNEALPGDSRNTIYGAATTPTVVLGYKGNYFFDVEFNGIEKSGLTYVSSNYTYLQRA